MNTDINKLFVYGTLLQGEPRGKFINDCNLLSALEVPGDLYSTEMGYPVALFKPYHESTITGELYDIPSDNMKERIKGFDELEGTDSGLFIRKELKYNGHHFYAYEAGKSFVNILTNKNKINSGNWRYHGSIAKINPSQFAINFEINLSRNYQVFPPRDFKECIYLRGDLPILITAPHATAHIRMKKLKEEEISTGAISVILHSLKGSHALYTHRASTIDANFYDQSTFKEELRTIVKKFGIKLVLDIHGTSTKRNDDIYPGVGINREFLIGNDIYLDNLFQAAQDNNICVGGLDVFPASRQMTVTKYLARELGIPAMQIEINERLRIPYDSPNNFERLIKFLSQFLNSIKS
ncbi:gamma-glutamylcyclotransferase [Desulfobacterota bacterium AH_259_B03_O07]|nr:gamma-glutamylcyclotransferase [Desulfobacterota bacterium AH_259_B03_O07]